MSQDMNEAVQKAVRVKPPAAPAEGHPPATAGPAGQHTSGHSQKNVISTKPAPAARKTAAIPPRGEK